MRKSLKNYSLESDVRKERSDRIKPQTRDSTYLCIKISN